MLPLVVHKLPINPAQRGVYYILLLGFCFFTAEKAGRPLVLPKIKQQE